MKICDHKNSDGVACSRAAVRKCVKRMTDESHYCCGVHCLTHRGRHYVLFKIDENGRSVNPGQERATA